MRGFNPSPAKTMVDNAPHKPGAVHSRTAESAPEALFHPLCTNRAPPPQIMPRNLLVSATEGMLVGFLAGLWRTTGVAPGCHSAGAASPRPGWPGLMRWPPTLGRPLDVFPLVRSLERRGQDRSLARGRSPAAGYGNQRDWAVVLPIAPEANPAHAAEREKGRDLSPGQLTGGPGPFPRPVAAR